MCKLTQLNHVKPVCILKQIYAGNHYRQQKRKETVTKRNVTGLEITADQRTMSGLIVDLTGQTFVLPVMLTGQNSIVLKMK